MAFLEKNEGYRHFFTPVPLVDWEDNFDCKLIQSVGELEEELKKAEGEIIAYDCETDGLDYGIHEIVGFSFSLDANTGFYVPLKHEKYELVESQVPKTDEQGNVILAKSGKGKGTPLMKKITDKVFTPYESNLPAKECLDLIYNALTKSKLTLCHNVLFDMMMLKKEGYDVNKIPLFDTMILTYNADTNAKGFFGLKESSEHFLGRRATKFKEVLGKEKTFKHVDPVDCVHYASSDSANTFGLFQKLFPLLEKEGCRKIMELDNNLIKSFLNYYLENKLYIDKKTMREYRDEIIKRKEELEIKIFEIVGYPFNIRSKSNQLVEALRSLGIDTGMKTEKGAMCVSKEALEGIAEQHPIANYLIELSSLEKQLNSYIDKLAECNSEDDNQDVGTCRINYKLFGTASGRLASGNSVKAKSDENSYFINLNIQNLTKPGVAYYEATKVGTTGKDILGWDFKLVDEDYMKQNPDRYYVEGMSPDINVRKAITTKDENEIIASLDFSGQEIKLGGIITGEDNFIRPFKEGKDVHTEMAKKLFGEENYDKSKRKAAKVANFGLLYGGNWVILQQVGKQQGVDLSDEEAQDLFNRWWSANTTLKAWKQIQIDKTEKENNFTVRDLFGRPRRVKYYLQSEDRGLYNFGVRTIASHKIQGTGASIMRNLLVNLHKRIFSHPVYSKHVKYVSSVHDEVNYRVRKEKLVPWVKAIEDMMIFNPPNFPIPIDCSIELGYSLGSLFPFVWEDANRTILVPKRA